MKTLSEDRIVNDIRAETYDSDSTCAGRADLDIFEKPVCCPFKTDFWDCTGCHPDLRKVFSAFDWLKDLELQFDWPHHFENLFKCSLP